MRARPMMPATIRVCGTDWTVKPWGQQASHNTEAYGMCDKSTLVILIRADMAIQQEAQVLLHEVFHACWTMGGMREFNDANDEERVVSIVTYQFLTVIRDNPAFIKYLQEAFRS